MLFLTKDSSLAIDLVRGILRYWPFANRCKESLFLSELQEVLEVADSEQMKDLVVPVFKRIAK